MTDKDDDARWIETVLASLSSRSLEARDALAKALLDGQSSSTDPVGCAKLKKSTESEHLKDAHPLSCDTTVLHTNPSTHALTDCPHEDFSDSGCRTTVYHKRWKKNARGNLFRFPLANICQWQTIGPIAQSTTSPLAIRARAIVTGYICQSMRLIALSPRL